MTVDFALRATGAIVAPVITLGALLLAAGALLLVRQRRRHTAA